MAYVLTTLAVGGTEKQVLAIAGRMAARGHAVVLVVLKPQEIDDCATDLSVVHLNIGKDAGSVVEGLRSGYRFLASFRPDVIHSHNFHGNMFARAMRVLHRDAKLISTIHNVYEGGRLRMLAYRMSDGLVDRTTAVSTAVAERYIVMQAVTKGNCTVLPNGVDTAEFAPDGDRRGRLRAELASGDDFVWLTVGRGTAAKDRQNLLEAFGNVCRDRGGTQLWIAGEAAPGNGTTDEIFSAAMPVSAREKCAGWACGRTFQRCWMRPTDSC